MGFIAEMKKREVGEMKREMKRLRGKKDATFEERRKAEKMGGWLESMVCTVLSGVSYVR